MLDTTPTSARRIETEVPARLDRLTWSRFHTLVVVALGITWVLDGLEVTIAGSIAGALEQSPVLHFTAGDVGLASSCYLIGAVAGALYFGWLTDRLGRKKLFFITLAVYLTATAATAFSWNVWSFCFFRLLTGAGIGGEYSAINSTIQELIPARYRGHTDIAINGSFWIGAAVGALASIVLLNPAYFSIDVGWRLAFFIGAVLGLIILFMRMWIPESPRWLAIHGREAEAERDVAAIEKRILEGGGKIDDSKPLTKIAIIARTHTPLAQVFDQLFHVHRTRSLVALALMSAQAFFYNAIFFTYALVLTRFYNVPANDVGWYILPFAVGNVLGPLILGRFFDTIGRKIMISFTYILSGVLLAATGWMFDAGLLSASAQTICWSVIFFFASAAAGAAYLTVSETFPIEIRALAIAFFYAIGTGIGGVAGPILFGYLIESGSRGSVFLGYLLGAVLMIVAGIVEAIWGVAAERKSLESVATPLSMATA
jgi:MFS family permease